MPSQVVVRCAAAMIACIALLPGQSGAGVASVESVSRKHGGKAELMSRRRRAGFHIVERSKGAQTPPPRPAPRSPLRRKKD